MRFLLGQCWLLSTVIWKLCMISPGPAMIGSCCPPPRMELSGRSAVLDVNKVAKSDEQETQRRGCHCILFFLREWNVEKLLENAQKVLPHPSFVYCAQYHPGAQNLVVTGSYDCLIRVWRLDVDDVNGQMLQEFETHKSFINSVCFDFEGTSEPTNNS